MQEEAGPSPSAPVYPGPLTRVNPEDGRPILVCPWLGCEDKTFKVRSTQETHIGMHTHPYPCADSACNPPRTEKGRSFANAALLKSHEKWTHDKHGGPSCRWYCPLVGCDYHKKTGFETRKLRDTHLRRKWHPSIEDKETIWYCPVTSCVRHTGDSFMKSSDLEEHLTRSHGPAKEWYCQVESCKRHKEAFGKRRYRMRHMKHAHPDVVVHDDDVDDDDDEDVDDITESAPSHIADSHSQALSHFYKDHFRPASRPASSASLLSIPNPNFYQEEAERLRADLKKKNDDFEQMQEVQTRENQRREAEIARLLQGRDREIARLQEGKDREIALLQEGRDREIALL